MNTRTRTEPLAIILGLFAIGNLANGAWMLVAPVHWYHNLPANVPGSGPLNEHFVRDLGCVFTLLGVALAVAVRKREFRISALSAATAFYTAHAAVHIYDTMRGLFEPGQWRLDAGPVYASTILLAIVTMWAARSRSDEGA